MFTQNLTFYTLFSVVVNYMFTPILAPFALLAVNDTYGSAVVLATNSLFAVVQGIYACAFWSVVYFTNAHSENFFITPTALKIYPYLITSDNLLYMGYFTLAYGLSLIFVFGLPQFILGLHAFRKAHKLVIPTTSSTILEA